jgi:uncharacterized RDD family membrane protein YckC
MTDQHLQLDSTIEIVTPENIAFRYRVAGPFRRLVALGIDYMVRGAISTLAYITIAFVASMIGRPLLVASLGVILVIEFVLGYFYGALFECFWNGRTPGKAAMGIRALSLTGRPINGMQAVIRNLFRMADTLPLINLTQVYPSIELAGIPMAPLNLFAVGLVTMALDSRHRRIGDLVAGTIVVVDERSWLAGVSRVEDPRTPHLAELIPADFLVTRSMAQALSMYVDRRKYFSDARRREVARHLAEPLLRVFGLPPDTSWDLLLCALYYRTFIADRGDAAHRQARDESPFSFRGVPWPPAGTAIGVAAPETGGRAPAGPTHSATGSQGAVR